MNNQIKAEPNPGIPTFAAGDAVSSDRNIRELVDKAVRAVTIRLEGADPESWSLMNAFGNHAYHHLAVQGGSIELSINIDDTAKRTCWVKVETKGGGTEHAMSADLPLGCHQGLTPSNIAYLLCRTMTDAATSVVGQEITPAWSPGIRDILQMRDHAGHDHVELFAFAIPATAVSKASAGLIVDPDGMRRRIELDASHAPSMPMRFEVTDQSTAATPRTWIRLHVPMASFDVPPIDAIDRLRTAVSERKSGVSRKCPAEQQCAGTKT